MTNRPDERRCGGKPGEPGLVWNERKPGVPFKVYCPGCPDCYPEPQIAESLGRLIKGGNVMPAEGEREGEMTWREQIVSAFEAVEAAQAERQRVLGAALDAGLSTRQIAEVVPVSGVTVWRMAGGKRNQKKRPSLLDAPAAIADPEEAAKNLPEAEHKAYEESQQSIVDAAVWSRERRRP